MTRVLVIDDDVENIKVVSLLLKRLISDCMVMTAQSGKEGIKQAVKNLPDTILVDMKMPQMNGFEVCKRLRADKRTKRIPIIMVTGVEADYFKIYDLKNASVGIVMAMRGIESTLLLNPDDPLLEKKIEDILNVVLYGIVKR